MTSTLSGLALSPEHIVVSPGLFCVLNGLASD